MIYLRTSSSLLLLIATNNSSINGFSVTSSSLLTNHQQQQCNNHLLAVPPSQEDDQRKEIEEESASTNRRRLLRSSSSAFASSLGLFVATDSALAVQQAVGLAEKRCQEKGNCLQNGDWDAAVGWQWGAKERCDPTDPKCGVNGKIRDLKGSPVPPTLAAKITHTVQMRIKIGRGDEEGTLRFGLYGDSCPQSVGQLVQFLSPQGLLTSPLASYSYDSFSSLTQPVTLANSYGLGGVTEIIPDKCVSLGVTSQGAAFARANGLNAPGPGFVAQPKPACPSIEKESSVRAHDHAGLISIPNKGIGYGGGDNKSDDEAFSNAFSITTTANAEKLSPLNSSRKVIGQVLDEESMAFLGRVAQLPTNKGFKGIIPGQDSGPPLIKTTVTKVTIAVVVDNNEKEKNEEETTTTIDNSDVTAATTTT